MANARFFGHRVMMALILSVLLATPAFGATKMPAFNLKDVTTKKQISSKNLQGNSLLIMFFATWCPPCIQEIPNLIDIQNTYGKKKFSIVGLSVDQEGEGVVKKLIKKKNINYPVAMANEKVLRGFGGVYGVPTAFLVNRKGNIVKKYTGFIPHSVLVKDIKQVIR
ncbi:MAG: TlpA family protein disulfide reductase [Desulfobulbaceae bacterium]|nr:MAG: TlpA family protein disulfide reductase [Desulfobulbaceae bacterium]